MNNNRINEIRADVIKYFDTQALIPGTETVFFSPDRSYYFQSNQYRQTDSNRNWTVSLIQIFQENNDKLFEYIRNDDSLFHGWLTTSGKDYLLLSEDIEGKSIFDLSERKFYSYSFSDDNFIWCEYHPSPDGRYLAIVGCYWACSYELLVFDTSSPTIYPYQLLYKQSTPWHKLEWKDNQSLLITDSDNKNNIVTMERYQ